MKKREQLSFSTDIFDREAANKVSEQIMDVYNSGTIEQQMEDNEDEQKEENKGSVH